MEVLRNASQFGHVFKEKMNEESTGASYSCRAVPVAPYSLICVRLIEFEITFPSHFQLSKLIHNWPGK